MKSIKIWLSVGLTGKISGIDFATPSEGILVTYGDVLTIITASFLLVTLTEFRNRLVFAVLVYQTASFTLSPSIRVSEEKVCVVPSRIESDGQ
jgi:hypothetical protein